MLENASNNMENTPPNRIRELRNARGITVERLSELTGISASHLSRLETGKRNLTTKHMRVIAEALSILPSELVDAARAWIDVDLYGIVAADQEIVSMPKGVTPLHKMAVSLPAALAEVEAVLVTGGTLAPRYSDGDVITFTWATAVLPTLSGRECVVKLHNGRSFIKTLLPGTQPGTFHLQGPGSAPMLDVAIERVGLIGFVIRA